MLSHQLTKGKSDTYLESFDVWQLSEKEPSHRLMEKEQTAGSFATKS